MCVKKGRTCDSRPVAGLWPSVLIAVGSLGLIGSGALPWASHGAGSSVVGFVAANLVLASRHFLPSAPWWIGLVWYVIPFVGAMGMMSLGLGVSVVAPRWCLVVATLGFGIALGFGALIAVDRGAAAVGLGAVIAVASSAALCLGMVAARRQRVNGSTKGRAL